MAPRTWTVWSLLYLVAFVRPTVKLTSAIVSLTATR